MPGHRKGNGRIGGTAVLAVLVLSGASALLAASQTAVTTYHYDNKRTGWNRNEAVLTPANVGSKSFGLLQTVALDDQVDAQPLVVPDVVITAGQYPGTHDVVYVTTEGNTVYATAQVTARGSAPHQSRLALSSPKQLDRMSPERNIQPMEPLLRLR
jgi:hypothetical protein